MWSAAILAGGRATRFDGRDKGSVVVEGRSIRAHQLHHLSAVTTDILLVGAPDAPAAGDPPTPTLRHVRDRVPGLGPLSGLDAALAAARHDVMVVVACDMPFITSAFLLYLLSRAEEAEVVVPRTERGYHPLCAVYTRACQPAIARRLAEGRPRLTGLFDEVRVRIVEAADIEPFGTPARLLANVNSPADLETLARLPR